MTGCIVIPGFELRAALRMRPGLALRPAALAPTPGTEPLVGAVTAAAEAQGIRPGMRRGEALATCRFGGHDIWWLVEAAAAPEALAQLPFFVARRATVTRVGAVEIP